MSRRPLHAALSLALGCATWASLTFAQSPVTTPAQNQALQTLTVAEPGRPAEKCELLQSWRMDDGSPAMKVKSLATGEIMTVVEPVQNTTAKDRFRVYRWGKSVTPPAGSPVPPQAVEERDEAPARKWPSAHETTRTSTPAKTVAAGAARVESRTQPSSSKVSSYGASPAGRTAPGKPDAMSQVDKEESRAKPPVVVAPAPPEPWTGSASASSSRKSEATKVESKTAGVKGETPARLAAAVTAPSTPLSPAMDRNPAVPASTPVAPAAPAVAALTKRAPEPALPAVSPPASSKTPAPSALSQPAERIGPPADRPVKKTESAQVAAAVQRVVPEKPAERLSPPTAPEEPGIVSQSKPAVSLLPSEPPTPILQVGASAAPAASTSRAIVRPTPPPGEKQSASVARQDQGAALDYGQVVSRTAPALPANGVQVTPRRIGPDPLANPDQYVRLNKRDRDERTPLPANSTLPSNALQVERPAKPQATGTAKAGPKAEPTPVPNKAPTKEDTKLAGKPPAAKPAPEPKREVVQASAKEAKPSAPKLERPEPPAPVAAVTAPPPPSLDRDKKQEVAQAKKAASPAGRPQTPPKQTPVAAATPVVSSEIRQVALVAPAQAQMVKPTPAADVSTLQGMADLIKVLSDSGVASHRQKAATELGAVNAASHPYVVAALTSAAKRDDTAQVRIACIHSLKQMRSDSPTTKEALEAGIADADPRVRDAAAEALRAFPAKRPTIQPVTGFSP